MVDLDVVHAWWRAANYLSAIQIYLLDDPLLKRPLEPSRIKPRLLGHWGTIPALNLTWAHLNRVIVERDIEALYVCGPGHGGQAMISNAWLEGSYSQLFPQIERDEAGMQKLAKQFSFPGGVPSHAAPETPGSINEGGELGYSLSHAYGAVLDNPDLIAACVVGDGEAETGPLAASWHLGKLIDPVKDGAVLPILNLNGWKIANPTLLARIPEADLAALLTGYGYEPMFVSGGFDGEDPMVVHAALASALDAAIDRILAIRHAFREEGETSLPRWPVVVLRTPKGWTGPDVVDGLPVEGTWRAHQVPLDAVREKPEHLAQLEAWLRSYRPEELFGADGVPNARLDALIPVPERRMSLSRHAHGGVRQPLELPDLAPHAIDVPAARNTTAGATDAAGGWLAEVMRANPETFRLLGPDEVQSNHLTPVLEVTPRVWAPRIEEVDRYLGHSGRVTEVLSEHLLEGLAEGYLLTGRHAVFTSYEAFIHIVDSMFNQHAKWIESAAKVPWREPIPAMTYLLSSHVWRQDHNGFSHQDPGFMNIVLNKQASVSRIYLPPDANTLLVTLEHTLATTDVVNVVIAGKNAEPAWLTLDEARQHLTDGVSEWAWAGTADAGARPEVVLACAGDVPTLETVAAAGLLRDAVPDLAVRVVNVLDLMRLQDADRHPHGLEAARFDELFTTDVPVVFAFHGYPSLVHELTYKRANQAGFHVHGYQERGTTTTPFDMVSLNELDRYSLASDALVRADAAAGRRPDAHAELVADWQRARDEARAYAHEHGIDPPEIDAWVHDSRT